MADLQETVGQVIRRERKERHLTLKELADRAGLSEVYLGEVERGKKYPSSTVLERLALSLDIPLPELLEMVADELRGPQEAPLVSAIGFLQPEEAAAPRISIRRIVNLLQPEEVNTIADLGAFFLSRRAGGGQES
jgi:transcriptional regulator with XRE-family HTH domain